MRRSGCEAAISRVRVAEVQTGDELAGLSRAFNRMTGQLSAQRGELMDAYSQIDERRRFTETVLSGVSAGVIGLDASGCIELPNRVADELLGIDLMSCDRPRTCAMSCRSSPTCCTRPRRRLSAHAPRRYRSDRRRAGARCWCASGPIYPAGRTDGFVVTFDDITELQSAQRKAAWADVARRIAHEIKNPLTPIQLAAERLKRRFAKRNHHRSRDIQAMRRHHHPSCRRYRPHGGRVLRVCTDAAAGDQARGCRSRRARDAGAAKDRASADRLAIGHSRARARSRRAIVV